MELEDLIERDLALTVQLPEGQERSVTVRGSEPVMDLLVTLCARYHLNPSDHVIELFSRNRNHIKFKPNSLIGCLEAEWVELKPKRCAASKRAPNVPVATVRLIVNYRKSHKAVVRVNPRVPLAELMPVVCEKCELNPDTTLFLRDSQSDEPLDLTKTLNDYGLRDVYAKDMKAVSKDSATATHKVCQGQKLVTVEKENRGLLCLFRRSKKAADERAGAPSSPVLSSQVSAGCLNANSSSSTPSSDMLKKRRAPQPPVMPGSQSIPSGLNSRQDANGPRDAANGKKDGLSGISSTESSLKRTKRKAPPPPGISPSPSDSGDKERSYVGASINPTSLEDAEEADLNDTSFEQYSDLPQSVPSSPLMTEILSEFMDRMNAQEEKRFSSEGSFTNPHQTLSQSPKLHTPLSGFLESDPMGQPTCKMMNHTTQRDGLTTFTVVPQRKRQSLHQYEFILTLESLDSLDQNNKESGKHPEGGNGDLEGSVQKKIENPELGDIRVTTVDKTDEVQEMKKNGELTVSELAVKTVELNLNEDACEHPLVRDKMEDQVEEVKDWIEEFRQKRKIFESDDEKPVKLHSKWFHKALLVDQMEAMIEDLPTSPLPVCWEEDIESLNPEESATALGLHKTKQKDESDTPTIYPKSNHENSDKHNDPYWDVKLSIDLFPDDSDSQHSPDSSEPKPDLNPPSNTYQAISPTQAKGHALSPSQDPVSKPKVQTSVEQPSPSSLSLFALAVSRRAQSLRQRACPLMLSAGGFSSPIQSTHR